MPGRCFNEIAELAAAQHGYITAEDGRYLGISESTLRKLAQRGQLERPARGVYRLPLIPPGPLDLYMEAILWAHRTDAAVSHESALALYELSDVNPEKITIAVPKSYRPRRDVPAYLSIRHEDLNPGDVQVLEGIPTVTPAKAIRQCHAAHLRRDLLVQAIDDGQRKGWLRRDEVAALRRELDSSATAPAESAG